MRCQRIVLQSAVVRHSVLSVQLMTEQEQEDSLVTHNPTMLVLSRAKAADAAAVFLPAI